MGALPLSYLGDDVLRQVAEPVKAISSEVRKTIEAMFATCAAEQGIGLAAPQVGLAKRIIVIDMSEHDLEPFCLVNPVLKRRSGPPMTDEEGCLSLPGVFLEVTRPRDILVEGRDEKGRLLRFEASDLLARCIQHEIDHLDGKVFTDHVKDATRRDEELKALDARLVDLRAARQAAMLAGGR
ncbi:MAG: peptide deformylase [Candidatus Sericytochromatia bacterium]|nr:peptide deformylase [Candidatus Sericytochromatia bacterium]